MLDSIKPREGKQPFSEHTAGAFAAPPKRKSRLKLWLVLLGLLLLAGGIFVGSKLVLLADKILEGDGVAVTFRNFFIAPDKQLQGEEEGAVKILLLGIGGQGHDGGTLTDTMILATLKTPKEKDEKLQVGLVSIPRDLLANIPGYDWRKINSAYAFGELGGQKQGPALTLQTIENALGLSIPYYAVIDFEGFEKVIDDLGGVEINVEVGFTDSLFPDGRDGYLAPLTFDEGLQKMDGTRALQYVRSRHGNNNQGSDFARSRRQQQVLKAVKEKATSFRILTNLGLIEKILDDLTDHVRTNFEPFELKRLYSLSKELDGQNIHSLTIDVASGFVCNQILEENQAYVLIPCEGLGKYEKIRELVKNQFLLSGLQKEQPAIEIQNATRIPALAARVEQVLQGPFLKITTSNFRGQTNYQQTIIYDNTRGQKPETLKYLREKLGKQIAQSPFPFQTASQNPDFVIIVLEDL